MPEAGIGETEIRTERSRGLARYTLHRIKNYDELAADTEQEGDERFKQKTKELWKNFAVHGIVRRNEQTGENVIINHTDLDGKAALGLLNLAGIETKRITYVKPGVAVNEALNLDTGGITGIVAEEGGKRVVIDHHADESGRDTSTTKYVYESLVDLGLLEKKEELDNLVNFVTEADNKTFPDFNFGESWRTMDGLQRYATFDNLHGFFRQGKDPSEILSEQDIKYFGLEKGSQGQKELVERTPEEFKKLQEEGLVVESERYGKVVINVEGQSRLSGGFDAAKFCGCDTYIAFGPNSFFITSTKPIEDDFGPGFKLRETMWVCPLPITDEIAAEKPDLDALLDKMTDGKFEPTGKLAEFLGESSDINKVSEIIGKATDKEEPPLPPEAPNLSPETEGGKIGDMGERVDKYTREIFEQEKTKLPFGEKLSIITDAEKTGEEIPWVSDEYFRTLIEEAGRPSNQDAESLRDLIREGRAYYLSHLNDPEVKKQWQVLAPIFDEEITRLGNLEKEEKKQPEKEKQLREKISKTADEAINIVAEINEAIGELEEIINRVNNSDFLSELNSIKGKIKKIKSDAGQAKIEVVNGELSSARTLAESAKADAEALINSVEKLKKKIEETEEISKMEKNLDEAKQAVLVVESHIVETGAVLDKIVIIINEAIGIATELGNSAKKAELQTTLQAVNLIRNLAKTIALKIVLSKKEIDDVSQLPNEKLAEKHKGTEEVKKKTEGILKEVEEAKKETAEIFKSAEEAREKVSKEKEEMLRREQEKEIWIRYEYEHRNIRDEIQKNRGRPSYWAELSIEEKGVWDIEWKLSQAAEYKKENSAFPAELIKNKDLLSLDNKEMERLYSIPGVKEALERYVEFIYKLEEVSGITIFDCKTMDDFEKFRADLREYLRNGIFNNIISSSEVEKLKLENKLMRADAIAWNWIWCSNLIESMDSRYSRSGRRHDLIPEMCSDDLRAIFHPQEKAEDKWLSGLAWGKYGEWGKTQTNTERIMKEYGVEKKNIVFKGASKPSEYWVTSKLSSGEVIVLVPECYPTQLMFSFWEAYPSGDKSLLDALLDKRSINWSGVYADAWKTNYLTTLLGKAIYIFSIAVEGKAEKGWGVNLIDALKRLDLKKKLGEKRLHNLKFWTYNAITGGVKYPEKREFTYRYGPADKHARETELGTREYPLLKALGVKPPLVHFLDKGETLNIWDL